MKKSESIKELAIFEDNDLVALGLLCKVLRERRSERFVEDWLKPLQLIYPITLRKNGSYSITTCEHGIIDYWPKVNKLLIRKDNQWVKPGLHWLIKNLLKYYVHFAQPLKDLFCCSSYKYQSIRFFA